MHASWVSWVLNAECDALANSARITRELSFSPSVLPPSVHVAWCTVIVEFSRRFTRLVVVHLNPPLSHQRGPQDDAGDLLLLLALSGFG